jgi:hypothetical protein
VARGQALRAALLDPLPRAFFLVWYFALRHRDPS